MAGRGDSASNRAVAVVASSSELPRTPITAAAGTTRAEMRRISGDSDDANVPLITSAISSVAANPNQT